MATRSITQHIYPAYNVNPPIGFDNSGNLITPASVGNTAGTPLTVLDGLLNNECHLYKLISANMNITTDQAFTKIGSGWTTFFITSIRVVNASGSLSTAAGGVYNAASKGGSAIVAATQAYSALTGATLGLLLTLNASGIGLALQNDSTGPLVFSLTTGQGSAMTADIYVKGVIVS